LGDGQGQDTLNLSRIDGDSADPHALPDQLLGDQASEGVTDGNRIGLEGMDDLRVVGGDVIDAGVCDEPRLASLLLDGNWLAGPSWGDGFVSGLVKKLDPGGPALGVQPHSMNEDDGPTSCSHCLSYLSWWMGGLHISG
jgi:hypothetical protein